MAEDQITSGKWGTISFEIPDFLEDTRNAINDVAELLVVALDIAVQALNLIKAYSVGYIDPAAAVVQALIDEIKKVLDDFRQLGIYITGDYNLLDWPMDDLRGGFAEYERRMVSRLTDRTDPTRPDLSSGTTAMAVFFYLSADSTGVERVRSFVRQVATLFNLSFSPKGSLPMPVVTRVEYGSETTGVFGALDNILRFSATPPTKARVTWKVSPTTTKHPFNPFPALGPGGFLVTVSTVPEGIPLVFDRPKADDATDKAADGTMVQPREHGQVRDQNGLPVVLHGGYEMLVAPSKKGGFPPNSHISYNEAVAGKGKAKNGVGRVYGVKSLASNDIIPLEHLWDGKNYYLQRTFYVGFSEVAFEWPTQEYSITLDLEDMPNDAEFVLGSDGKFTVKDLGKAGTYYVRVASTTKEVGNREKEYCYDLVASGARNAALPGQPYKVMLRHGLTPDSASVFSSPVQVSFPNTYTKEFIDSVATALVVLALSRSDLPVADALVETQGKKVVESAKAHKTLIPQVALQATGLEPFAHLLDVLFPNFKKFIETPGQDPKIFRQELLNRARALAKELHAKMGSRPELEQFVVQSTANLRKVTWQNILATAEPKIAALLPKDVDGTLLAYLSDEPPSQADDIKKFNFDKPKFDPLEAPAVAPGFSTDFGVAPNPYSMGLPAQDVDVVFLIPDVVRGRKPHFIEVEAQDKDFNPQYEISAAEAAGALALAPPGLRIFYEKFRQADGSIVIPNEVKSYLEALKGAGRKIGSADLSPVFFSGKRHLVNTTQWYTPGKTVFINDETGLVYCRTLLGQYQNGLLYREAAIALGLAAAAFRRPLVEGEWVAVRFFDTFPGMEGFFAAISNWLDAMSSSIQSAADAIIQYIEFVEARLVETQQLIRRINALIDSILGFSVAIPQCSALLVVGKGTDGVLSGLITADNKPSDSPLAYGGGVAVVVPTLPAFLMDLFLLKDGKQDTTTAISTSSPTPAFGLEALPSEDLEAPDDEPDVL